MIMKQFAVPVLCDSMYRTDIDELCSCYDDHCPQTKFESRQLAK